MIDDKGRTPLDAFKETGRVSKYLTKDNTGHYWEPHELSLIGAGSNRKGDMGAACLGRDNSQAAI
jgi:hypothetical protein